ncbi:hypothetical protein Vadar_029883 [Vaccinium darrowii]|uniref:Uncharacterized protein n=1 Tax=Vaccinium darrowii TaxID=229202 RepID=A0ACB7Y9K8_9ERIC|nr:hypothetical protein Vadar_029883 [Vaccinium darrowii]
MVTFKDGVNNGQPILSIFEGKSASIGAVHLPVFEPVISSPSPCHPAVADLFHPTQWFINSEEDLFDSTDSATIPSSTAILLQSSLHSNEDGSERFILLGDQINAQRATWTDPLASFGQFSFIERYWEWLEDVLGRFSEVLSSARIYGAVYASLFTYSRDENLIRSFCELWCPSTNTLHTPEGKLSISLWDLTYIGGLPVYGRFYDEVILPAQDLTGHGESNKSFLPPSCKYLFSAYRKLVHASETHQVTAHAWVSFWFRQKSRYTDHSPNDQRERANKPTGQINKPLRRTRNEEGVFDDLAIKTSVQEEAYLAALLSCWLSVLVLPNEEVNQIRPTVFKVASMMARGCTFSLAVPILASIYRSLKQISSSPTPNQCNAVLPMHYICCWLGNYFDAYHQSAHTFPGVRMVRIAGDHMAKHFTAATAHNLLRSVKLSQLSSLSLSTRDEQLIVYDGAQSHSQTDYIISLRSSYLILRRDNEYVVEPYSPHRFSRQFDFCQDIPGNLVEEACPINLPDVVGLWQSCTKLGTKAEFKVPAHSRKGLTTKRYMEWWAIYSSDFVKSNIEPSTKQGMPNPQVRIRLKKSNAVASTPSKPKAPTTKKSKPAKEPVLPSSNTLKVRRTNAKANKGKEAILPSSTTNEIEGTGTQTGKARPSRTKQSKAKNATKDAPNVVKRSIPKAKTLLKILAPKLQSVVVKDPIAENGKRKRSLQICDRESSSSHGDRHWKRLKKKPKVSNLGKKTTILDLEDIPLDVDEFFKDHPLTETPLEDLGARLGIDNLNLEDEVYSQSSEESIDGPDPCPLVIRRKRVEEGPHQVAHENISDPPIILRKEPPQLQAKPSLPALSMVSVFQGDKLISSCQRNYVSSLWAELSGKIGESRLNHVHTIEEEAEKILQEMSKMNQVDISPLRNHLQNFFKKVQEYNSARSSTSEKMHEEQQSQELASVSQRLSVAELEEGEINKEFQLCQQQFESIEAKEAQLKKELKDLGIKRKEMEAQLLAHENELFKRQADVSRLKEEVSTIQNAAVPSDADIENLEQMKNLLEALQKELADFKLFP